MVSFHKILADGFFILAALAIFAAAIGWSIGDIWLASSQWVMIGVFIMLVAIYTKLSAKEDEEIIKSYKANSKKK
jgi:protein-S-isoprenylcysteine O-methyltransferase Ste14